MTRGRYSSSQLFFAVLALILGVLVLTDRATLQLVYVMAFLLGVANVIDKPVRHSFVLELVGTKVPPTPSR